jgi:hypothetical protein
MSVINSRFDCDIHFYDLLVFLNMIIFRSASLCHAANTKDHNGNKSFFVLFCVILGVGVHVILFSYVI